MRLLFATVLAFGVGFLCRTFGIPSPSPTVLIGSVLAIGMTTGYRAMDRWLARARP